MSQSAVVWLCIAYYTFGVVLGTLGTYFIILKERK